MPGHLTFRVRRPQTWSCLGSAIAHGLVLAGILVGQWWFRLSGAPDAEASNTRIVIEGGFLPWATPRDESSPVEVADAADDRQDIPSREFVEGKVDEAIAAAQGQTLETQLEQLKRRSAELSGVSSAESIDQMARQLNALLGTKSRAEKPAAEPVAGPFDFDTAQLHDVRREPVETGGYRYQTVLVDAEGRRFETDVDAATGEQLFKVFEIIRGNPLLEKVYRQVVMSLLDKLSERPSGP